MHARALQILCWGLFASFTVTLSGQTEKPLDVSGEWDAVFGDSTSAGTSTLILKQDASGHVTGSYATTLGGNGTVAGQITGSHFAVTLVQTQSRCPGSFQGSVDFTSGSGEGSFSGRDCLGVHENGMVSLRPKRDMLTPPPPSITRDKDGNVQPYTLTYENGVPFWLSRSSSAFLAVGAKEIGGYFRLTVLVGNSGEAPFTFQPEAVQVLDANSGKTLPYLSPEKIAEKIERRAAFAAGLMAFSNGLRAYSNSMVTVRTTGQLSMYDSYGSWAQGSYIGTSQVRMPVNTAQLSAENQRNSALVAERANQVVAALNKTAIRAQTLGPKSYIVGNAIFPRAKVENMKAMTHKEYKSYFVRVIVPVNGENFLFLFPVELLQALPHP